MKFSILNLSKGVSKCKCGVNLFLSLSCLVSGYGGSLDPATHCKRYNSIFLMPKVRDVVKPPTEPSFTGVLDLRGAASEDWLNHSGFGPAGERTDYVVVFERSLEKFATEENIGWFHESILLKQAGTPNYFKKSREELSSL